VPGLDFGRKHFCGGLFGWFNAGGERIPSGLPQGMPHADAAKAIIIPSGGVRGLEVDPLKVCEWAGI
jgi:hypothetical protein